MFEDDLDEENAVKHNRTAIEPITDESDEVDEDEGTRQDPLSSKWSYELLGKKYTQTRYKRGQSGNPRGRPKVPYSVRALARERTDGAVNILTSILIDPKTTDYCRMAAARALLGIAWEQPRPIPELNNQKMTIQEYIDDLKLSRFGLSQSAIDAVKPMLNLIQAERNKAIRAIDVTVSAQRKLQLDAND